MRPPILMDLPEALETERHLIRPPMPGATLAIAKANTASSAPILRAAGFSRVARERRYALDLPARSPGANLHLRPA